ncbi:MAG TPA: hypothetical protein VFN87_17775 [Solirubrobacteraceae bacterium]|nr:hypothetical protein [Solirubrobacteraceae bacterium]
MRLRLPLLTCALTACVCTAAPAAAGAAPVRNDGVTIHAAPRHIIAGEAVLIYGRLNGPGHGGQTIRLYHRINPAPRFSLIGVTRTNSNGQYEFTRVENIVETNRSWFVRGPGLTHSRTVHERVAALVTLASSASTAPTRHPLVFSGHVTPGHRGSPVALQVQRGSGDAWRTIRWARIGVGSNYNIPFAWRVPGVYTVRTLCPGNPRNVAAPSDPVTVVIQQAEVTGFTIATSDPVVANGQPVTISGTLDQPGTTTPQPGASVSLFARGAGPHPPHRFRELTTTTTGADGTYSFGNLASTRNELYQVRTTFAPARHTAVLFEGVQDVVDLQTSSPTSTVGAHVTFTGAVSPDKAGHIVYLQKLGRDDSWHTVEVRRVSRASTFRFGWTFGAAGMKQFRARILGGPANIGGASAPVAIDVTQPPLSALPTG